MSRTRPGYAAIVVAVGVASAVSFGAPEAGVPQAAAKPFGEPHPDAPPEIRQFEFLVGNHDCVEEVRNPETDEWFQGDKTWDGRYILGGRAIQDGGASPWRGFEATNIRVYDPDRATWVVSWFGTPAQRGIWEGGVEGDELVVRQGNDNGTSILTFHDISQNGFSWRAEFQPHGGEIRLQWRIRCEKVGPRD